jgi:cytochrome c oxidase subunit 2
MVIDDPDAFATWLGRHPTFAQVSARPPGDPAAGQARYGVCAGCHGAQGEGNPAMNAPKLAGLGDWYLRRQLVHFKQGARGTHEKDTFGKIMAPMAATLPDEKAIDDVAAYIMTLPEQSPGGAVKGDVKSGRSRYAVCAACHGADGRGIAQMNAPRLQGMSDWYLERQLKSFRDGIRGVHPQDVYGSQMALLAATLNDDQAISDVVAYIGSL